MALLNPISRQNAVSADETVSLPERPSVPALRAGVQQRGRLRRPLGRGGLW